MWRLKQPECHTSTEEDATRRGIRMPEITIPEYAYPAIQKLAHLSAEDFNIFVKALEDAKPTASLYSFWRQVAKNASQISAPTIKTIVNELFSMNKSIENWNMSAKDFAKLVSDAAFSELSEEFQINEADRDILRDRLVRMLELKASLGLTAKASDLLTDAQHLFYTAKILTDLRPVFNEEGTKIEGAVIVHNLALHYGEGTEHKDFFIVLDANDMEELQMVLERAEEKAEALQSLMKNSHIPYLSVEE